jgi:hypothetical protein
MALDASARRRWFGGLVLLAAAAMLVCGETGLKGKLGMLAFLAYWLVCLALTGLAMMIAFLDVRALQRRIRREQRDLFDSMLKKIEAEAKTKPPPPGRQRSGP